MNKTFQHEMIVCTLLYRMIELEERVPLVLEKTPYEFIDNVLSDMFRLGLIEIGSDQSHYEPTQKAASLIDTLAQMSQELLKFEIFSHVNLLIEEPDGVDDFDPRFALPSSEEQADEWGCEDLRLAVIDFGSCWLCKPKQPVDLHRIVFLQMLSEGIFEGDSIWFDLQLGMPFETIREIVSRAYSWKDCAETEEEAVGIMQAIYDAGMMEAHGKQHTTDGFVNFALLAAPLF